VFRCRIFSTYSASLLCLQVNSPTRYNLDIKCNLWKRIGEMAKSAPTTAYRTQFEDEITQVQTSSPTTNCDKNVTSRSSSSEKPTDFDFEERAAHFADLDANHKKKQVCRLNLNSISRYISYTLVLLVPGHTFTYNF